MSPDDLPVPPSAPARPVTAKPTGRRRWKAVLVALIAGLLLGRYACGPIERVDPPAQDTVSATIWTCSMHPQIRLPEPGACPICGMDLIPVPTGGEQGLHPRTLVMGPDAAALARIQTAPVERREVSREVRMVGRVAFDETRLSYITAWVPFRIERLFVDYTGVTVRKGDHMVEVYSPNLIATQQELLQAIATQERLEGSSVEAVTSRQAASVQSSRDRLRLWGLEAWQIDAIVERGEPLEHVTINAPVSGIVVHKNALHGDQVDTGTRIYTIADLTKVWVQLDAYESDLAWLHYGQNVTFETEAWPGETFAGRISFVDPVLDNRTRTVRLRVNVENEDLRLKPDMFVRATVLAPMSEGGRLVDPELAGMWMGPMHPEIVSDVPGDCPICGMSLVPTEELGFRESVPEELPLVIPATAPLITGARAVVYVQVPDAEEPTYQGRDVTLGPRAGDWYVVRDGLAEGEQVVVNGAFKLDSELQIRAEPSMMNPVGGVPPSSHAHGGGPTRDVGSSHAMHAQPTGPSAGRFDAPDVFLEQVGDAVVAYLAAQAGLAADDAEAARSAAGTLADALARVDADPLGAEATARWEELSGSLADAAEQLHGGDTLDAQRLAFARLSEVLAEVLDRFGYGGSAPELVLFHCPMALQSGADWIQAGNATANPYYGDAMPRCGEQVRAFPGER